MRSGELDQRIALLEYDPGVSGTGSGASIEDWVRVARTFARVTPVRGNERFLELARHSETTHRVRIRYRSRLEESWRVEWRGEHYDIVEILPGGRRLREYQDLMVQRSDALNPRG